jgi:lipopolysaccharide/colanic/teichoic acid biosynthesis glycosyltransferase
MTSEALHFVYVDPWAPAAADIGADRRSSLIKRLASGGHRVTIVGSGNDAQVRLPALSRKFGFPADTPAPRGYGVRLFSALSRVRDADVVVLSHPPRKGGLAAVLYAMFSGVPLVLDTREVAPEKRDQNLLSRIADKIRLAALKWKVTHVFAATPEIKQWYERAGFSPSLISLAPDGCDTTSVEQEVEAALSLLQKHPQFLTGPLAVYAGGFNRGRPLSALLDIAAAARVHAPDLNFLLVGDGPDRLDLNAFAARLDVLEKNVWFLPAQPRTTVVGVLNAATVVIALPPQFLNGGIEAGSHLFQALAAGKPLAVLGDGWQRDLIEGRQAGVSLPMGNPTAAARELSDFLQSAELVRRAGEQASALAQGKHNSARVAADMRQTLEKIASLHSRQAVMMGRYSFSKRTLDVVLSLSLITVLSPLFVLMTALSLAAGWTPIAGRERGGRRGKPFLLFTFDTLKADQTRPQSWAHRYAHLLRRTALDRLPELFNVLIGHMSFVGPRPLPAQYTAYYTEGQLRRLDVRPGITGWAQINGRQGLTWEEMFAHDFYYVENRSFGLDLKILLKTIFAALTGKRAETPAGQLPRFDAIQARRQGAED